MACKVFSGTGQGLVPLYRLYSHAPDHFYTMSTKEVTSAIARSGYTLEGIVGYVYPTATPGAIPLYRLWNPTTSDHFYTTSVPEREKASRELGYQNEGIAAYVLAG